MASVVNQYDVFFCYSWANRGLAKDLVAALHGRGLRVFRDESGMDNFDEIAPAIAAALYSSRTLVALYTPEFPRSAYCRWELYTALSRASDLDGHTQRVLAVLHGVDYADLRPRRLAGLRLQPPGSATGATADAVAAKVRSTDSRVFGEAPQQSQPDWYPYPTEPSPRFQGRLAELWDLHEALVVTDEVERSRPNLARVVGLGGQGKTVLAEEYARRFARDHPGGIYVLRGFGSHLHGPAGGASLRLLRDRQVAQIVRLLGHDVAGFTPAEVDGVLRRHLEDDGRTYLWLIDDLPAGVDSATYRALLAPTAAGHTLVTTRDAAADLGGVRIDLVELDDAAAMALLTSRRTATNDERRVVRQLACVDLGGHAQGLDLAAGLSASSDFGGYAALRAVITRHDRDALQLAAELRGELPGGHAASLASTLLRSIEKLGAAGRAVLQLVSLLAPAPVPEPLLAAALAEADGGDQERATTAARDGLNDAAGRSLARPLRTEDPALWAVHALVIRAVRSADLSTTHRAVLHRALLAVIIHELDRGRETLRYRRLVEYLPHVPTIAQLPGEDPTEVYVHNEAGRAYVELGQLADAVAIYEELYASCLRTLGEHDLTTLAVLAALGVAYGLGGQHQRAMAAKVSAHDGLVAALGPDHPDTITTLNNIGVSHLELREPGPAKVIFGEVYRARRRLLGVHHTETLIALGNLACAAGAAGGHAFACRLRRVVHERLRRIRGDDDPLVLEALNNLGASQRALGQLGAAMDSFRLVYEGRRQSLGERHPETVAAVNNLATVDEARAQELLDGAYRTLVSDGDPGSPLVLRVLHNLLIATGDTTVAITVRDDPAAVGALDRSADDRMLIPLEDFDPNTDWRLGVFLRAQQVHADVVATAGPDEPETLLALCRLAHATALLGQVDQQLDAAAVLIEGAASGLRELLGANHPDAALATRLQSWISDTMDDRPQAADE